jgi:hypothetical protein
MLMTAEMSWYCLNLVKMDMIATGAHGKKTKNKYLKILFSVSFRVLLWLLNKSGVQLKTVQHALFSG